MDFENFKISADGIDGILISGNQPKRCIIAFSSMNKGKYERWSWFKELHDAGSEDLYIVLKDDSQHFYIGSETNALNLKHYKFFTEVLTKHDIGTENLFLLGSSMGGFAALYYGFWLGAKGIIAVNPQTTYSASRRHKLQNWERLIRETGSNWVDLDQFIHRFENKPIVYLEHSDYPADQLAAESLILALQERNIPYIRNYVGGEHGGTSLTKLKLLNFISFSGAL